MKIKDPGQSQKTRANPKPREKRKTEGKVERQGQKTETRGNPENPTAQTRQPEKAKEKRRNFRRFSILSASQ
jgi:hypothetical protein